MNGFGPKVLVELSTVSLLGGWKTDEAPRSESTPSVHNERYMLPS